MTNPVITHLYFTCITYRVLAMSSDTIEVRVLLRHYWTRDHFTRSTDDAINEVEGEDTTSKFTAAH
jgi:hypothetical protein